MNPPPRIAILGIHLESNAFAPVTTEADFRASCYFEGPSMLAEAAKPAPAMPAEIPGFVEAMNATGPWEPVPEVLTCVAGFGIAVFPEPQATIVLPAGTPAGSLCTAAIPCRPNAFVALAAGGGSTSSVRATVGLHGPRA